MSHKGRAKSHLLNPQNMYLKINFRADHKYLKIQTPTISLNNLSKDSIKLISSLMMIPLRWRESTMVKEDLSTLVLWLQKPLCIEWLMT